MDDTGYQRTPLGPTRSPPSVDFPSAEALNAEIARLQRLLEDLRGESTVMDDEVHAVERDLLALLARRREMAGRW